MESVVPDDYEALCRDWITGPPSANGWRELLHALGGRVGWWFLDPRAYADYDGGPMWCFGSADESRLTLIAVGSRFSVYVADTDEEVELDAIGDLVAWLDVYEEEFEGISPMLGQLLDDQLSRRTNRPPDR